MPIGEVTEEIDVSVHDVELGAEDLHELDRDFGEMECSMDDDSDKDEKEESTTPTNKQHLMPGQYDVRIMSVYHFTTLGKFSR